MNTSRAMVFSFLVLFMAGGLFLSTFISTVTAAITATMLCLVGVTTLILDRSHARR